MLHLVAMVIIERSSAVLASRFDMHFVMSFQQHLYLKQWLYVVSGSAVCLFINTDKVEDQQQSLLFITIQKIAFHNLYSRQHPYLSDEEQFILIGKTETWIWIVTKKQIENGLVVYCACPWGLLVGWTVMLWLQHCLTWLLFCYCLNMFCF